MTTTEPTPKVDRCVICGHDAAKKAACDDCGAFGRRPAARREPADEPVEDSIA